MPRIDGSRELSGTSKHRHLRLHPHIVVLGVRIVTVEFLQELAILHASERELLLRPTPSTVTAWTYTAGASSRIEEGGVSAYMRYGM
jgi:hypothetical protein